MTIPIRNPYIFDDRESLYDFLHGSGLQIRPESPVLKLRSLPPKPPQNPDSVSIQGNTYPISVPPSDPNYIWVTNRDTLSGKWFPVNSPIREEDVGPTTFRTIGGDQTYQSQHHGVNTSKESAMTDEELSNQLGSWNLPTEGNRKELFERNVRARLHPTFQQNMAAGSQPNEAELADILGKQDISLAEAARIRELRRQMQPQTNSSSLNQPSTNTQLQGTTTTTTTTQPPNVVQPPLPQEPQGPLYGGTMRLGDEAPMSTSIIGGGASETQPLTQSPNLYSRIAPQANTGAVATEEAGAMGGMEMMASRAIPMLNMVLMGKMLVDGVTADSKQKKMQQQALMYRT